MKKIQSLTAATTVGFILLIDAPFSGGLRAHASDEPEKLSPSELITKYHKQLTKERDYELNRYSYVDNKKLRLELFTVNDENTPDWWSKKQSYNLRSLLYLALQKYPGLSIEEPENWDNFLLREELGESEKHEGDKKSKTKKKHIPSILRSVYENSNDEKISIKGAISNYLFQSLKPKKRGIGLGFISFTSKKCTSETFLGINYSGTSENTIEPGFLEEKQYLNFDSNVLSTSTTGGTSVNLNLGVGSIGGGNFDKPELLLKEAVYKNVVDAAEGIYCSLSGNLDCIQFYETRKQPEFKNIKKEGATGNSDC